MKVRELVKVIGGNKELFIKPDGHRCYFEGLIDDIPESLMGATIRELAPQINYYEDKTNPKRYYWSLGLWVTPIREWDALVDANPEIIKWEGEYSDLLYYAIIENYDNFMEDLAQTAKENNQKNLTQFNIIWKEWQKEGKLPT